MCGICGFSPSTGQEEDRQLIETMKSYLYHRGPDGEGSYFSGECILGHRRLSIIDLETGNQPMPNEDKTVWIVFNGEIYNYRQLWKELESCGHRFLSHHSDTEVIIHGYEEWGTEVFKKLNGIFSIAIWDSRNHSLIMARDHIGVKPLYYTVVNGKIIFASEPKAILCHNDIKVEINTEQVANYFFFRAPVHPDTMFKGIKKLSPGSYIVWDNATKTCKESTYWKPMATIDMDLSEKECLEKVEQLLYDSVQGQLISDVPLGIFLSGGVDSSLIATKMIQGGAEDIDGFVISVGGNKDEGFWSDKVANHLGVTNHKLRVNGRDFLEALNQWTFFNDDPVSDPSALALFLLSRFAKEHGKKVMLSGEGGDELFAGYNSYLRFVVLDAANKVPSGSSLLCNLMRLLRRDSFREQDYILIKDKHWRFLGTGHTSSFKLLSYILKNDIKPFEIISDSLERYGENTGSPLSCACVFDQRLRLPDDILVRTDRATMAASIEARVPLLDYRLIELANSIPQKVMLKGFQLKHILKMLALKVLPHDVILRKKMGFDLPLKEWLQGALADNLRAYIRERKLPFINYKNMETMLTRFFQGDDEYVDFIWAYLLLEQWYELWCRDSIPEPQSFNYAAVNH